LDLAKQRPLNANSHIRYRACARTILALRIERRRSYRCQQKRTPTGGLDDQVDGDTAWTRRSL